MILKLLFLTLEIVKNLSCYQPVGHIVAGDLNIITDSRTQSIICKGSKYMFPLPIDFKTCVRKLLSPYKKFVIAGVNESMLNLTP